MLTPDVIDWKLFGDQLLYCTLLVGKGIGEKDKKWTGFQMDWLTQVQNMDLL